MKKQLFLVFMGIVCSFWGCKSNVFKDNGTYFGTTPCADCPGIDINLQLNSNFTYKMSISYQDKWDTICYSGHFTWNKLNKQIVLEGVKENGAFEHYLIKGKKLLLLTPEAQIVEGVNANYYWLSKL